MLLSVSGTAMVGDDGSGAATAWRDDANCFPGCYAYADGYASAPTSTTTSTPTPARSAIEQWQQLR